MNDEPTPTADETVEVDERTKVAVDFLQGLLPSAGPARRRVYNAALADILELASTRED